MSWLTFEGLKILLFNFLLQHMKRVETVCGLTERSGIHKPKHCLLVVMVFRNELIRTKELSIAASA